MDYVNIVILVNVDVCDRYKVENMEGEIFGSTNEIGEKHDIDEFDYTCHTLTDFADECNSGEFNLEDNWIAFAKLRLKQQSNEQ